MLGGVQIPREGIFEVEKRPRTYPRTCPADDILKATQQGQNRHGADSDWCTHWSNLANTIEPSVCGDDTALSNYFDHLF